MQRSSFKQGMITDTNGRKKPDMALASSNLEQDDLQSVEKDGEVEEHRKALDVVEIVLELLQRILDRSGVAATHLGMAGPSRLHVQPLAEERHLLLELRHEDGALGARTHHAHVSPQHVP